MASALIIKAPKFETLAMETQILSHVAPEETLVTPPGNLPKLLMNLKSYEPFEWYL